MEQHIYIFYRYNLPSEPDRCRLMQNHGRPQVQHLGH